MKPKHIKKETAKRLREGFHTDLMGLIEEAIDLYGEKEFERGYQSFFGDAHVHASRIASDLKCAFAKKKLTEDKTAIVIEDYFNSLKAE